MSAPVRRSRGLKSLVTGLVVAASVAASVAAVSSPATAGAPPSSIWGSPDDDRECVDVSSGLPPAPTPVSMELITSLVQLEDDGSLVAPSGSVDSNGRITANLPPQFFFEGYAFYLTSVEFVEDCSDEPLNPVPLEVCFDSDALILWPIPVSDTMTFLIIITEESSPTVVIDVSTPPSCESAEEPDPDVIEEELGLEDIGEVVDEVLDRVDIEGEYLIRRGFGDFDSIDLDHYRRMAEEQENALPNTR
jgi:hypothetical protein